MNKLFALLLIITSMNMHAMEQDSYQNDGFEIQPYCVNPRPYWYSNGEVFEYDEPHDLSNSPAFDYQEFAKNIVIGRLMSDTIFQMEDDYDNAMDGDDSFHILKSISVQEAFKDKQIEASNEEVGALTILKKTANLESFHTEALKEIKYILDMRRKQLPRNNKFDFFICHICKSLNNNINPIKIRDHSIPNHFKTKRHKAAFRYYSNNGIDQDFIIQINKSII